MKNRFLNLMLCFSVSASLFTSLPHVYADDDILADSGINYTEKVSTINNPGAGYTSTVWYTCKPGDTPVKNPTGNLVVLFVDIGAFSSGVNGTTNADTGEYTEGTDYDLDESFFEGLKGTLENCRKNGSTVGLRFRYDANGKTKPEPATFEKVLDHINQIGNSGLLEEYEDILMYVESGFVGAWGEQHSGKYTSTDYKAQVLDAMLKIVPKSVAVTVRTPDTFCKWARITTSELSTYTSEENPDAARVGLYNDGYMGSDTDLGTFINPKRADSIEWMKKQMLHTYYGGEFSGNITFAQKYDTYLPENCINEMYNTHLSYINSNIWQLYKDYTFGEEYYSGDADNSAYYGTNVYQFIRDHIGYRFVLRNSKLTPETTKGGNVKVEFSIENTGFANVIKSQKSEVILEKDGNYIVADADVNDKNWETQKTTADSLDLKLPGDIEEGNWNVYLRLSVGKSDVLTANQRTVAFANEDVYNSSLGANYLGTVSVKNTDDKKLLSDNTFSEKGGATVSDGTIYTCNGIKKTDGTISKNEWAEDELVTSSENNSNLYISADENYLYVCAKMLDDAVSPVYNLQLKGTEDSDRFWIYHQTNGYVYFNRKDYSGITCKYNGGTVEWKIPLDNSVGVYNGETLEYLRVFIQDSSVSGWKLIDELKTTDYKINGNFKIYTKERTVKLPQGNNFDMNVLTDAKEPVYQWYFNDKPIENATSDKYTIENASSENIGKYHVVVTSSDRNSQDIAVCNVEEILSDKLKGDLNSDNAVNVSDVVLLQKKILGYDVEIVDYESADIDENKKINVIDLALLKEIVTE